MTITIAGAWPGQNGSAYSGASGTLNTDSPVVFSETNQPFLQGRVPCWAWFESVASTSAPRIEVLPSAGWVALMSQAGTTWRWGPVWIDGVSTRYNPRTAGSGTYRFLNVIAPPRTPIMLRGTEINFSGNPVVHVGRTSVPAGTYVINDQNFPGIGRYLPCLATVYGGVNAVASISFDGGNTFRQLGENAFNESPTLPLDGVSSRVVLTAASDVGFVIYPFPTILTSGSLWRAVISVSVPANTNFSIDATNIPALAPYLPCWAVCSMSVNAFYRMATGENTFVDNVTPRWGNLYWLDGRTIQVQSTATGGTLVIGVLGG